MPAELTFGFLCPGLFSPSSLHDVCNHSTSGSASLHEVTYVDPKGDTELDARLQMAYSTLAIAVRSYLPDLLAPVGGGLKHFAFQEEKEWRLLNLNIKFDPYRFRLAHGHIGRCADDHVRLSISRRYGVGVGTWSHAGSATTATDDSP